MCMFCTLSDFQTIPNQLIPTLHAIYCDIGNKTPNFVIHSITLVYTFRDTNGFLHASDGKIAT